MSANRDRKLKRLNRVFPHLDLEGRLQHLQEVFNGSGVFSASLELESRVIAHAVESARLPIEIFTLDRAEELEHALRDASVWLSGIRRVHLPFRTGVSGRAFFEYDENYRVFRFHPLLDWSLEDLRNYLEKNDLPCPPPSGPAPIPVIGHGGDDYGLYAA